MIVTALGLIGVGCTLLYYLSLTGDHNIELADSLNEHSKCWANDVFGQARSLNDNRVYELTEQMCEASQTNWGGDGMNIRRAADQLFSCDGGRGLNVYVVGGSITCGAGQNRATRPDSPCPSLKSGIPCYDDAWPKKLEDILNTRYPCSQPGVRHTVVNDCVGGVASDYWVDKFAQDRRILDHPLTTADVVLVETAANDGWLETTTEAQVNTELLARLLRRLDSRPLAMWITASWHGGAYNWTDPAVARRKLGYHRDAEDEHLKVMRYYNIPHISVLQAFQPLAGSVARHEFLQNVFQTDVVHPSRLGHKMIASIVAHRLTKQTRVASRAGIWFAGYSSSAYIIPRVLSREAAHQATILDRVDEEPLHFDFITHSSVQNMTGSIVERSGFEFVEDVPGKLGLIGTTVGSNVTLALPDLKTGLVHIGALHSYQNMGLMTVSLIVPDLNISNVGDDANTGTFAIQRRCRRLVRAGPPSSAEAAGEKVETLVSRTIDTLWEQRVSVMESSHLYITMRSLKQRKVHCGWLRFSIEEAAPSRTKNKIKLLQVSVF